MSSSSGILSPRTALPLSVSTRFFLSPSLTMSARPFLLSHPTATLSMPPDMAWARASMSMEPPASEIRFTATLSGSPSTTD